MRIKISENQKFALRVAGIFMRGNSVLLHRADFEDLWALPGGGCDYFEETQAALKREMLEELNANIDVQSLAFTVENFFNYSQSNYHEIGFYYFTKFVGDSVPLYEADEFTGIEEKLEGRSEFRLLFKWVPVDEINSYNLKPSFLKTKLLNLKQTTTHIVHRDIDQVV